jgi:hypothetical protein
MKSSRIRFGAGAAVLSLATLALTPQALAQAEDQAASRALFDEGRRFADSGKYDLACSKFDAARKLYVSAGVLLNLGDCYEKIGRTASAWTTFGEAASVANRTKRTEDAAEAKRRQALLEPRLDHLSIHVAHEVPGLTVQRDGVEVPSAAWNEPIPVDPGAHEIRAEATGCAPWTTAINLLPQDQTKTFDVPELQHSDALQTLTSSGTNQSAAGLPQFVPESSSKYSPGSGQRLAGMFVGGVGIVTMITGGVLGLVAKTQDSTAETEVGQASHTDSESAVNLGNIATIVTVIGVAATAVGAIIWLTAPNASAKVGTNGRELLLWGTF